MDLSWWHFGYLIAIAVISVTAFHYARKAPELHWINELAVIVMAIIVATLSYLALYAHDRHVDLTAHKIFTLEEESELLLSNLRVPVRMHYFSRSDDPHAKRLVRLLEAASRRFANFSFTHVDPDKEPAIARSYGAKAYNAAVLESPNNRIALRTTDELEVMLAAQKLIREKQVQICALTGHGEYDIDNEEFHTHIEAIGGAVDDHGHGHSHQEVIRTDAHGIGRFRRNLEGLGYEVTSLNLLADTQPLDDCSVVISAGPNTPYLDGELKLLQQYLDDGGSLLLLVDLGLSVSSAMKSFFKNLGIGLGSGVIVDPKQHYDGDLEQLAVTSYEDHEITSNVAMTIYPGVRPVVVDNTHTSDRAVKTLVRGSPSSYVADFEQMQHTHHAPEDTSHPHSTNIEPNIAVASEKITQRKQAPEDALVTDILSRAIVVGDADFLSNSYFPYLSNSALATEMIQWLAGESNKATLLPKTFVPPLVILTYQQMRLIFMMLVIVTPMVVFGFGLLVWWRGR